MSCNSKRNTGSSSLPVVITPRIRPPRQTVDPPKVGDFHCGECNLTLKKRRETFKHQCRPIDQRPPYQQQRTIACEACEQSVDGVCQAYKRLHPDRDCGITVGIKTPYAACPQGKWHRVMIRCPKCSAKIFDDSGPKACRYCGWQDQSINRPDVPAVTRTALPAGAMVVTAANRKFIRGVYFLVWTLLRLHDVRVLVFCDDVPRNDPHVTQMKSWGVEFTSMPMDHGRDVFFYSTWNKPACILQAMQRADQVLWLDSDTAIAKPLDDAFAIIAKQPFAANHGYFNKVIQNTDRVWQILGQPKRAFLGGKQPCAGVIGFKSDRDRGLIEQWRERCQKIVPYPQLWMPPTAEVLAKPSDEESLAEIGDVASGAIVNQWQQRQDQLARRRSSSNPREGEQHSELKYYDQGVLTDLWDWDTFDGTRWSFFGGIQGTIKDTLGEVMGSEKTTIFHYGGSRKPWFKWPERLNWGDPRQ